MQANNSPRFLKNFMIGLVASSAGAFIALPGSAMPESSETSTEVEATEAVETLDAVEAPAPGSVETLPTADAEALEVEPVAADESMEMDVVEDTELTDETVVEDTELTDETVVEESEMTDETVVEDAESVEEDPVAGEELDTGEFTIAELTDNSDSFEILAEALAAADLTEILGGEGPFTVFAPTDDAFAALPEGAVEQLLLPENKDVLVQVLPYHVDPGALLSTDLETGSDETVEGSEVALDVADTVTVNNANVVVADVEASNGVIHIIDRVIIPPSPEADAGSVETEEATSAE